MTEPVAELPVEVAEEVKSVSVALAARITQLATELNDKAGCPGARYRVASETGTPAVRQREAGQQAELSLVFQYRRVD